MAVVIDIKVPGTGKKPYEVAWSLETATREQVVSAVKLLEVLTRKLTEHANERWPNSM